MPELINVFSWSMSAARDFEECPRKRYWSKYAMWNGWKSNAPSVQRTAYRLNKMENRFTLTGRAVEKAAMWMLRRLQHGESATSGQAYTESARPFLNRCWLESKKRLWEENPKKFCCLHEHYYPDHHATPMQEMTDRITEHVKLCLVNFADKVLPKLGQINREQEIPVAGPEEGDPESVEIEGIKVYAIPDFVYSHAEELHIHDWKAGRQNPFHRDQMALYGTWAHMKNYAEIGRIRMHLEYLAAGEEVSAALTGTDVQGVREIIRRSAEDMAAYLVNGDIRENRPVPKEEWDMTADHDACRLCNFYELCKPELEPL